MNHFFVIILEIVLCDTNNSIIDFSIQIQTTFSIIIDSKDYNLCIFIVQEIKMSFHVGLEFCL